MRAAPATIGGMPRSSKRASERQSATSSRSPCTTWIAIAVWPSLKVVKSCARAAGSVLLRGMIRSTSPPIVSRPSDSGITSSSSRSPAPALPASAFGLDRGAERDDLVGIEVGQRRAAEELADGARTSGMRVEPPTSTTPLTSALRPWRRAAPAAPRRCVRATKRPCDALRSRARDRPAPRARRRPARTTARRASRRTALPWRRAPRPAAARRVAARVAADEPGSRQRPVGERGVDSRRRRAPSRRRWRRPRTRRASGAAARCRRCRRRGRRRRRGPRCALSRP